VKYTLILAAALLSPSWAQIVTEDFSGGNTDVWSLNQFTPATVSNSGGNPGGHILAPGMGNNGGATNLASKLLLPMGNGHPWSGDFRFMGVTGFQYDREQTAGGSAFGDSSYIILADDNGTPTLFNDDAFLIAQTPDIALQFGMVPWATIDTDIPSTSLTLPAGWQVLVTSNNPNSGSADDTVWNDVITNVDYIALSIGSPGPGFPIGSHDMKYDNFVLDDTPDTAFSTFCDPMTPNSTTMSTNLSGFGTTAAESGLHLHATDGPPSEFGYFLVGVTPNDPGIAVSQGFLCLGGGFGRYNVAGTNLNSTGQFDASGVFQNLVGTSTIGSGYDVPSNIPISGQGSIMAGETWHFQLWHRDTTAGSGLANFSNGLSVIF